MNITMTFTRGNTPVDTVLASGTIKRTDKVSGLTMFQKPGGSDWFRGSVASGELAGLPVNLGNRAMSEKQFDKLRAAIGEYFHEVEAGEHDVPVGFPHVAVEVTCESVTELPGRDGLITVFPNGVSHYSVSAQAPFESEAERNLKRKITIEAEAVNRVESRTGLVSALAKLLG